MAEPKKILVMGLPSSGKTFLSDILAKTFKLANFNADMIRKAANDWDFSIEGRIRQAERMAHLANFEVSKGRSVICDFVCPLEQGRLIFDADIVIWLNTIIESEYGDTNKLFEPPKNPEWVISYFLTEPKIISMFEQINFIPKQLLRKNMEHLEK